MATSAFRFDILLAASGIALMLDRGAQAQRPPSKQQCIDSYVAAQQLRKDNKLIDALQPLRACILNACPSTLRQDCGQWMAEVERAISSIVVVARDAAGNDMPGAQVWLDGKLASERQTGASIPVNPGEHLVRVVAPTGEVVEHTIVAVQGQKDRVLTIVLGAKASDAMPANSDLEPRGHDHQPGHTLAYLVGGAGVAALAVGSYFGIRTLSKWSDRNNHCPGARCDEAAISASEDAHRSARIADIAIGVGLVGVGVGTYLLVTASSPTKSESARLDTQAQRQHVGVSLGGRW